MAVSINLLPDVRQARIRDAERRQLLSIVLVGTLVLCGLVAGGLFAVTTAQQSQIKGLSASITDKKAQLTKDPDLIKILTAQQQVSSLDRLLTNKRYVTKVFNILTEISPTAKELMLTNLEIDDKNLMKVTVTGRDFLVADRFVKALVASNVKIGSKAAEGNLPDFTNVQLSTVATDTGSRTIFSITMQLADGVYDAKR